MAKKSKRAAQPRNPTTPRDIDRWLAQASRSLIMSDYAGVTAAAGRVLRVPSASPAQRAEALANMGGAYMLNEDYSEAYALLSEALALTPDDGMLWFNRGMTARFTMRLVRSLRDFERAESLDADGVLAGKLAEVLPFARSAAESERALRGPGFTLDQLMAQEELFQQAAREMERQRWAAAESLFREVIAQSDVLPQPWGNLGICLMMQRRFDDAEAALRRSLKIDPKYALARQNLAGLPAIRASGILPQIQISNPLKGGKAKQTLSLLIEGEKTLRDIR